MPTPFETGPERTFTVGRGCPADVGSIFVHSGTRYVVKRFEPCAAGRLKILYVREVAELNEAGEREVTRRMQDAARNIQFGWRGRVAWRMEDEFLCDCTSGIRPGTCFQYGGEEWITERTDHRSGAHYMHLKARTVAAPCDPPAPEMALIRADSYNNIQEIARLVQAMEHADLAEDRAQLWERCRRVEQELGSWVVRRNANGEVTGRRWMRRNVRVEIGAGRVEFGGETFEAENIELDANPHRSALREFTRSQFAEPYDGAAAQASESLRVAIGVRDSGFREMVETLTAEMCREFNLPAELMDATPREVPRIEDRAAGVQESRLTETERRFMLRHCGRMEAELRWLVENNPTVRDAWEDARRGKLSETSAAELAVIALARENEDLRRQLSSRRLVPVVAED